MTPTGCRLVLSSVRDLVAGCSCGRWHYLMVVPAADGRSDDELRRHAAAQHANHADSRRGIQR